MGRRSDHTRDELEALILDAAQQLMEEVGFARFSAREVAKRIGYSVGTVMHVFGSVDALVLEINTRTFILWAQWLEERLAEARGSERIRALVEGYFDFASQRSNLWSAIYEHRLPETMAMPEDLARRRSGLMAIVEREVTIVLPEAQHGEAARLSRSLVATVHGHCSFALGGSFALMGETEPLAMAMARVVEVLRAHGADLDSEDAGGPAA
ncbi:TetR family transcriptional regulator [Novosphingobium sp. PhB165]|uniref:TetR/AcrR family transcriptional regulator n=1 Tax=Novosphingobium sp. PhB165 TaxID=2485105 RepID=UPI001053C80F|nr:TetR/AcrR family transcriptional regulator [Novosphingobium sp. PhB165]TCM15411.1 TetR family transcriptional regulator [Novosphingobium sp. PhB165]